MKRSRNIRLVLLGGVSAGAFTACGPAPRVDEPHVTTDAVYENDHHIPGAGFYHAPFHGFYARPYNAYDAATKKFFYAGAWHESPFQSPVNISSPTPDAARLAESVRTDIPRGGFGSTSSGRSNYIHA